MNNETITLLIFAGLFLVLRFVANRGMDIAERRSNPATAAIGATLWLIIAFIAVPVLCLVAAALGGLI
jgi:hypothetical protein